METSSEQISTNSQAPPPECPLQNLPREIKSLIYSNLMTSHLRWNAAKTGTLLPPIAFANSQFYAELKEEYLSFNHFKIRLLAVSGGELGLWKVRETTVVKDVPRVLKGLLSALAKQKARDVFVAGRRCCDPSEGVSGAAWAATWEDVLRTIARTEDLLQSCVNCEISQCFQPVQLKKRLVGFLGHTPDPKPGPGDFIYAVLEHIQDHDAGVEKSFIVGGFFAIHKRHFADVDMESRAKFRILLVIGLNAGFVDFDSDDESSRLLFGGRKV